MLPLPPPVPEQRHWESLAPATRRVLLGERPRGVAGALKLLEAQGLVQGLVKTPLGVQVAEWGRTYGDLGWASWAVREAGQDARWTVDWARYEWARWRDILRLAVGLHPLDPPEMAGLWDGTEATSLVPECVGTPVRAVRGLSAAQAHYLLDCTAVPGDVGYAIHGYHMRVMCTLTDLELCVEQDGMAWYTPLGQAAATVWRGPRQFKKTEEKLAPSSV